MEYYRSCFSKLCSKHKYFIYLNNIVAIISSDVPFFVKNDLAELNDFFIKNKIYAGISDSFCDLFEMDKFFKQALNALNFGLNIGEKSNIYPFSNFRLEAALNADFKNMDKLRHPTVDNIYEYDKQHSTAYADVLLRYLQNREDVDQTAMSLNCDKSKIKSDIKNIQDIFGIDFESYSELSSLLVFLKLYKCFEEK